MAITTPCDNCNEQINTEDIYYGQDNEPLCLICFEDLYPNEDEEEDEDFNTEGYGIV